MWTIIGSLQKILHTECPLDLLQLNAHSKDVYSSPWNLC